MNGELASTSENLDQDVEQMRSEGKGRQFGIGTWQRVCARARVCVYNMRMASWHGKYERCQAGLRSSTGSVN